MFFLHCILGFFYCLLQRNAWSHASFSVFNEAFGYNCQVASLNAICVGEADFPSCTFLLQSNPWSIG